MLAAHQNMGTVLNMGITRSPPRNWKGIGISMLVVAMLASVIIVVILLLTPEDPSLGFRTPLTLADLESDEFQPRHPQVHWVTDDELVVLSDTGAMTKWHVSQKNSTLLVEDRDLHFLKASRFQTSPDLQFLLLACDVQQVFRYSSMARYLIYNVDTRETSYLDLRKPDAMHLQYAGWGAQDNQLVFVLDNDIYYQAGVYSQARQITSSGHLGAVFNGISDWLYEEEILHSSSAHWCSPDGVWLAYLSINDSMVPKMELPHFLGGNYPTSRHYPYPKAGQPIPSVRLFVVNLSEVLHSLELLPPEPFHGREYYITMVKWVAHSQLAVRWLNRAQNMSVLNLCDAATGACTEKYKLTSDTWVDMQQGVPIFSEDAETLFLPVPVKQGARGEFYHITMLSTQTSRKESSVRLLTSGNWDVTRILAYDENNRHLYFLSSEERPSARHLYSVDLDSSFNRTCVTCGLRPGCSFVDVSFSPRKGYFILFCKGPGIPQVSVHCTANPHDFLLLEENQSLQDGLLHKEMPLVEFRSYRLAGYDLPVRVTLPLPHQCTFCPLLLMLPEVLGGHEATEEFHLDWDTVLSSSLGAVVVQFDGRGSGNKGLKLLHEISHHLGSLDMKDHVALMKWLLQLPYVDQRSTAVYGKAYGGFLALKLLAAAEDLFKCGATVAPITSFRFHAATFSERYLGMPAWEDAAYTVASVLEEAARLKDRKFLLVHGTGDATVHFQHTAELLIQLLAAGSNYTTQIYPDEGHMFFLDHNQRHLRQTLSSFFQSCFEDPRNLHLLAEEDEDS
ncbi:inactive dipeptidyl peptidase 10-like [Sceloporus undulatus]|uniref:inactive dipeptidyl peptidase 10-like n=1 Tax=Sceloporus undulatus TaxID=8520 RepID=UPI001C4C9A83|nr:inactive dipeptidyl peptidase 10-like [Sceloporus undulatus]